MRLIKRPISLEVFRCSLSGIHIFDSLPISLFKLLFGNSKMKGKRKRGKKGEEKKKKGERGEKINKGKHYNRIFKKNYIFSPNLYGT